MDDYQPDLQQFPYFVNRLPFLNQLASRGHNDLGQIWLSKDLLHGPLDRYAKSRVAHAPGMPGTFSPPPTSKKTAIWRSRHASRHVRHARAVMHAGIATPRWRGKTLPAFPAHAQLAILRIWQEAHGDNKPLPEPILSYHLVCSVVFTTEQRHMKCSGNKSITRV